MDFSAVILDDEDIAFWNQVRDLLDEHKPEVDEHEWRTGDGINVELYQALGRRGWLMPWLPVEAGGIGASKVQIAILAKELLAYRVPQNAYSNTMQVQVLVEEFGCPELKAEVLGGVPRGEVRFCLGYTEPDAGSDLANVRTRARQDGDEWVVAGQKMFTTTAQHAHYALVLARTNPEAPKRRGLTTLLVPLNSRGVEIRAIHTLGGERTNMVFFDDVRVPDRYRIGAVNDAWTVMSSALKIEHGRGDSAASGFDVGGGLNFTRALATALDAALEWSRTPGRDGARPIDDPLVRAKLAGIATTVEMARLPTGPVGRVLSSDVLIRDAAELLSLVGAQSLIRRGEDGAVEGGHLEYIHRFAQGTSIYGGTTDIHRSMIAERYLGLPRSRLA
jgi:alkylation response protein AidB-like acyl-CoA dehydrogenase